MSKQLINLMLFIFAVLYVFAPIKGFLSTETVYVVEAHDTEPEPEATPEAVIEEAENDYNEVEAYVREVFGKHADKAFLLLNGNEYCGGENKQLNLSAVYTNTDGSRDRGLFQINDYYHPFVSDACAFDYKCNTDYAWRMFKNDNYTFIRWMYGDIK